MKDNGPCHHKSLYATWAICLLCWLREILKRFCLDGLVVIDYKKSQPPVRLQFLRQKFVHLKRI